MPKEDTFNAVSRLFSEVIQVDNISLERSSNAEDFEEWDSMRHLMFITAIEKHYDIKFKLHELIELNNIGSICDAIEGHIAD